MTKKEKEALRSCKAQVEKCEFTSGQPATRYLVSMCLSLGELMALKNALDQGTTIVGEDVRLYLSRACEQAGVSLS